MLFFVALSFSKLQTFLNNIPEGNLLKSVYLALKIAFTLMRTWSFNGHVAYLFLSTYGNKLKDNIALSIVAKIKN